MSPSPISDILDLSPEKFTFWKDYVQTLARVTKQLDAALRTQADIKLEDYKIMMILAEEKDETGEHQLTRMGTISHMLSCSPSKLTYQIDRLINKGWIERHDVDYDRRGRGVRITSEGLLKYYAASLVREQQLDLLIFNDLTPDENEAFARILHKIAQI